ncbi:MAG: NAD(P)/FAD-dependent oxidoreductase, partial [Ruminococcus sp.]|nr:NAD(P)/FAD-dependent oxidoreductase [Ruminococcus sp.]
MITEKDIIIIGGGASGLFAAIKAKENNPDKSVVILEAQSRVGRKLLSTGNGRCNLTNTGASKS